MHTTAATHLLHRKLLPALIAALVLIIAPRPLSAAFTWDGGGGNNNWTTNNNWNPNGAPAAGTLNDYIFGGTSRTTNSANGATPWEVNSITFNNTAGAFTISSTAGLKLQAGGVTNNDTQTQTINAAIALQATATFNANSGAITMGGVISGSSGITKTGSRTLTFSGTAANTFTGDTTVNVGTLTLAKTAGITAIAGNLIIGDGSGAASSAIIQLTNANQIADTTAVTIDSDGRFNLNSRNETIGSLASASTAANVQLGTATLTTGGDDTSTTFAGVIAGTGNLTKTGTGTFTLSGANTYSGTTTVSAGNLRISADSNLGGASAPLTLNGGTLNTTADLTMSATRTFTIGGSGGTVDTDSGTSLTYNGVLTGSGTLTKTGTGTFVSGGASGNTHTGDVMINAGVFEIAKTAYVGGIDNAAAVTVANGATLRFNGTAAYTQETIGSLAGDGTVTNVGAAAVNLAYGSDASTTFSGTLTNATNNLNLVKNGTGTFTLSGTNTYTGATTVNAGTLSVGTIGNGGVAGNLGQASNAATNLVLGGGTLEYTGSTASTDRSFTLTTGTTSTIDVTSAATNLTISGSSANTTGGLTKAGAGTLTLSGTNLHTGTTTVSAGTLMADGSASLGAASGNVTVTAGTLALAGGAAVTSGSPTNAATITKSGMLTLSGTGATATTGALHAAGATGQTSQWLGNITLSGDATISAADNLLILGNATIANYYDNTISLGANTLTFHTASATGVTPEYLSFPTYALDSSNILVNSTISGTGGIIKTGAGTLNLVNSGTANSYSGSTVITGGSLIIDGPGDAPVISSSNVTIGNASSPGAADSVVLRMGQAASPPSVSNMIGNSNTASGTASTSMTVYSDGVFDMNGGSNALVNLTLEGGHVGDFYLNTNPPTSRSSALGITGTITTNASASTAVIDNWKLGMSSNAFTLNVADGAAATDLRIDAIVVNDVGFTNSNTSTSLAKTGAGTAALTGANTYQGVTDIQAGTLVVKNNSALGQTGTYSGDLNNGTVVAAGAQLQLDGSGGNLTIGNETLTLNGDGTSLTGDLRNVAGSNVYNGFVSLGGNSRINADAGTTLTLGATPGSGSTLVNGTAAGRTLTIGGSGDTTVNAVIGSNIGTLVKDGTGTLTLAGQYAANATTTVKDGTLALNLTNGLTAAGATVTIGDGIGTASSASVLLSQSNQIADTAAVSLDTDGLLNLNSQSETIGSIAGNGTILLGTGQLIAGDATNTAFAGTLAGASSSIFTKTGAGTLTINSNVNATPGDFAGTLNLSGGALAFNVDNAFTGTVNVSAGTTLTLSNADLSIASLNLTGAGTITLDFTGTSTLSVTNLNIAAGVTLNIINWQDAADYFFAANWTGAVMDLTGTTPMNQVVFNAPTWTGNDTKWQSYDNQITPVPEPSTYGALLLGTMVALLGYRRCRNSKRETATPSATY